MSTSCSEEREALLECLAESECIAEGKSVKECMAHHGVCADARSRYALCKRGQLDMRKRIKGNNPFGGDEPPPADEKTPDADR